MANEDFSGGIMSPGGFAFGVQGWSWGEPRPRSITFFLDGTVMVGDQHGRPIRGTVTTDNKEVRFAMTPPSPEDPPGGARYIVAGGKKEVLRLATHIQVIDALANERVDWKTLTRSGWPQIPYEQLKELPELPPTPIEELRKIRDSVLRKDALRARREVDNARARELAEIEEE